MGGELGEERRGGEGRGGDIGERESWVGGMEEASAREGEEEGIQHRFPVMLFQGDLSLCRVL